MGRVGRIVGGGERLDNQGIKTNKGNRGNQEQHFININGHDGFIAMTGSLGHGTGISW